jgi:hypothetical protein
MFHHTNNDAYLYGFQLFAKDGTKLFESAYRHPYNSPQNCKSTETILEDDERIIGFKSRKASDSHA